MAIYVLVVKLTELLWSVQWTSSLFAADTQQYDVRLRFYEQMVSLLKVFLLITLLL